MKKGKRLLSLFLALVMTMSVGTVGFQAFAADPGDSYNLPETAEEAYDAMDEQLTELMPVIQDVLDMFDIDLDGLLNDLLGDLLETEISLDLSDGLGNALEPIVGGLYSMLGGLLLDLEFDLGGMQGIYTMDLDDMVEDALYDEVYAMLAGMGLGSWLGQAAALLQYSTQFDAGALHYAREPGSTSDDNQQIGMVEVPDALEALSFGGISFSHLYKTIWMSQLEYRNFIDDGTGVTWTKALDLGQYNDPEVNAYLDYAWPILEGLFLEEDPKALDYDEALMTPSAHVQTYLLNTLVNAAVMTVQNLEGSFGNIYLDFDIIILQIELDINLTHLVNWALGSPSETYANPRSGDGWTRLDFMELLEDVILDLTGNTDENILLWLTDRMPVFIQLIEVLMPFLFYEDGAGASGPIVDILDLIGMNLEMHVGDLNVILTDLVDDLAANHSGVALYQNLSAALHDELTQLQSEGYDYNSVYGLLRGLEAAGYAVMDSVTDPAYENTWSGFNGFADYYLESVVTLQGVDTATDASLLSGGNYTVGTGDNATKLYQTYEVFDELATRFLTDFLNPVLDLVDKAGRGGALDVLTDAVSISEILISINGLGDDSALWSILNTYLGIEDTKWQFGNHSAATGTAEYEGYVLSGYTTWFLLGNIVNFFDPLLPMLDDEYDGLFDFIDDLLAAILSLVDWTGDMTEGEWNFKTFQANGWKWAYPTGITDKDANNAVKDFDTLVDEVIKLLYDLDIINFKDLSKFVNGALYTNDNITALVTAIYPALDDLLDGYIDLGTSPAALASMLENTNYGKAYQSAANTIRNTGSWSALKNKSINWNFKDGDRDGFVSALAASLRPLSDMVGELLIMENTEDFIDFLFPLIADLLPGLLSELLGIDVNIAGDLLPQVQEELKGADYSNGSAYETAIIPLFEALLLDDQVLSYNDYVKAGAKRDNYIINLVNPLLVLVDDIVANPVSELSSLLPNLSMFIDNNGLSQVLDSLVSPILYTVLGIVYSLGNMDAIDLPMLLRAIGLELDIEGYDVIDALEDPYDLVDQLSVELDDFLNDWTEIPTGKFDLMNLSNYPLQDGLIPLVNNVLDEVGLDIQLSDINWGLMAERGTIKETSTKVRSQYTNGKRQISSANQGESMIAVLRYVLNEAFDLLDSDLLSGVYGSNDTIDQLLKGLSGASADEVIILIFYFLYGDAAYSYYDYTGYQYKTTQFRYPDGINNRNGTEFALLMDEMLDDFIDDLGGMVGDLIYTNSMVNMLMELIYVNLGDLEFGGMALNDILGALDMSLSTKSVSQILTDKSYGDTYNSVAQRVRTANTWSQVNFSKLDWGFKDGDKDGFVKALTASLRPLFPLLDMFLSGDTLNILTVIDIPGSNGYENFVVPFLEALGVKNITSYDQYQKNIAKSYDYLLLDILNPLFDMVDELLESPVYNLTNMLPDLALYIGNNGLLQLIDALLVPVTALLEECSSLVDVNGLLGDLLDMDIDLSNISSALEPWLGADEMVELAIDLVADLGFELLEFDWLTLASHGKVANETSAVKVIGQRKVVNTRTGEMMVALLRYLIDTLKAGDNLDSLMDMLGDMMASLDDSIMEIIAMFLDMLATMETDDIIIMLFTLFGLISDTDGSNPDTGDRSILPFVIITVVSAGAVAALVATRKKKEQE